MLLFAYKKNDNYHLIFVLIDKQTKIINYMPIKIAIYMLCFVKIMINIIVKYYNFSDSIIGNQNTFFILLI